MTDTVIQTFPGSLDLIRAQRAELPQKDALCGAFWGLLALRALLPHRVGIAELDQDAVARAAGTTLAPGDRPEFRPPGERARADYGSPLPPASDPARSGTSAGGLARAVAELAGECLVVVPATGDWQTDRLRQLLDRLAGWPVPLACLANLSTGWLWGTHPYPEQILGYLADGDDRSGPPSDWDVGHFVAVAGLITGPEGVLLTVVDSYPSLGRHGVHLQPVERVVAALRRNGAPGGLLMAAPREQEEPLVSAVTDAGLEPRLWDNGSIDARHPARRCPGT